MHINCSIGFEIAEAFVCLQAKAESSAMAALDDKLPAELPVKDGAAQLQMDGMPLDGMLEEVALDEDGMIKELVGLPWEFIVNKQARQEWAGMDRHFRWAAATLPMHEC